MTAHRIHRSPGVDSEGSPLDPAQHDEPTVITEADETDASAEPDGDPQDAPGGSGAGDPGPAPASGIVASLRAELAAKDAQLHSYIEAYKTARAEMDAARKRLARDKEKELGRVRMEVSRQLLDVLDNLDRSVSGVRPGARTEDIAAGLDMVRTQFFGVLEAFGVEPIEAMGQTFDANLHEATGAIPAQAGQTDQEIVFVQRKGYTFAGQLLRPSQVVVASRG